ncbi:MAG: N-acetylmuramoyl-L-alanine amidase [Methylococcales bacterium]|nr:N-acetylmuramoyl-L-alanine amidase [Methylococcales bacterium]
MRNTCIVLAFMGLQCMAGLVSAEALTVSSLRYWTQPTQARLVLDTTSMPITDVVLLHNPTRLVIDLKKARLASGLRQPSSDNRLFSRFYTALNANNDFTIVVELKKQVRFKNFTLSPRDTYGHRVVIDLFNADNAGTIVSTAPPKLITVAKVDTVKINDVSVQNASKTVTESHDPAIIMSVKTVARNPLKKADETVTATANNFVAVSRKTSGRHSAKDIVIAIDAGHGGKDPGSHGAAGTEEKQVVFAIAKKLERLIAGQPGMRAVMVRDGDQFIKLRQRMQIARAAKADLFVSIHADAFKDSAVKGSSVFTLSNRGATSEAARWLANNENAADLVGGVSLDDKDDMLASVLLDLSQTATTEASGNVAKKILANFKGVNPLHKSAVQKAGFMVLKSPDIPSILVETAFISNPEEELKLRSDVHQTKVAKAIFNGITAYFKQYVPIAVPTTRMAEAVHIDNG